MARVHYGSGIVHELYERRIYKRTPPSESFIVKPCVLSELPTELEAERESPALTVKTETVRHVIGSVKFNSVSDQRNSLMEEFSPSIASFWVTISLLLIFVLILSSFIFIIIYASIEIAFLVINYLMLYADVYIDCKTVRTFAHSSTGEQSNEARALRA